MAELDRNKPFGTIRGSMDECPEAHFTQDGKLFNPQGKEVCSKKESKPKQDVPPADELKQSEGEVAEGEPAQTESAGLADELAKMDADGLRQFALDVYGHKFHHKITDETKMRDTIVGLMNRG